MTLSNETTGQRSGRLQLAYSRPRWLVAKCKVDDSWDCEILHKVSVIDKGANPPAFWGLRYWYNHHAISGIRQNVGSARIDGPKILLEEGFEMY